MVSEQAVMKKESLNLNGFSSDPQGLPLYFLTGKNYLYQTLFCIKSLVKVSDQRFKFILVDDGSFDDEIINRVSSQLPGVEIITAQMISQNLKKEIPNHLFPVLNKKRIVYPHIKKLTDIHTLPGQDWKMVLDSDMLFWKQPDDIINWLKMPEKPIYMQDCQQSYGYSTALMQELCKKKISPLINVGAIGLNSKTIDWQKLEIWVAHLEELEGSSYYLEQAITAMLIGDTASEQLNAQEYIVNPNEQKINTKIGILHHYVDLSKDGYFKKAWKAI